ncbi:polysaccharide biosynthesis/export family protein [Granulosicoccus sp. 3-233]|uniref:polysaccharide biosynthesis/export family protein n=1 Tax=Granulosicoccus sp. 3-233 TaxID=3417969 RepID=UPI003D338B53
MPTTRSMKSRLSMFAGALLSLLLAVPTLVNAQAGNGLEYRIGPEDVLHISVWREEDLDRKVLVRPDGGISFPLAGDIQVSGRTPLEVQDEIRSRLQRYVPDAEVTVSVDKISGYTVFVLGEVEAPGQFTLGRYVDVVQALTLAGGFTPYASNRNIQVLRRQDGREVTYEFDFRDVSRGRNLEQNIILQSGDVVLVP